MAPKSTLTKQEKQDLAYVRGLSKNNESRDIDLSDPRQKSFYLTQLKLAGITKESYPQFFQNIEDFTSSKIPLNISLFATDQAEPVNVIAQLSSETSAGQKWETSALSSIPGGTESTKITLGLYDKDLNPIGKQETVDQINAGQAVTLQARGDFGSPMPADGREVVSIATIAWTDKTTGHGHLKNVFAKSVKFPKQINNLSPTDTNADDRIVVCLTRDGGNCDYYKQYSGNVEVPVQGSIVYNDPIDLENGKPKNATNIIEIARAVEGGNPITPPAGFDFFDSATVNGDTISWNFDWLSFGPANFASGDQVYYIFNVTLEAGGSEVTAYITNAPSSYTPGSNQFNTIYIDPMYIYYGCIARGTPITMADGSNKPIEEIQVGEEILSNVDGSILEVENTVVGTEEKPMIRIKTVDGYELLMSEGHPVITKRGVKLAKNLRIDDVVFTQKGKNKLSMIEEVNFPYSVHNLQLNSNGLDDSNKFDKTTMYANGILVGDHQMQWHYGSPKRQSLEDLLANTDEKWHQDILSSYRAGNLDIASKPV
ncbi:MAG: Hint domain-containing protein [Bacteroidota bacterium]